MPFTTAIDKSLKICSMCLYVPKENLTLRASYESVQIHIYLFVDNTITNLIQSIVYILHYAPLYSTLIGHRKPYETCLWAGGYEDMDLFNLNCTLAAKLCIWYKADKFVHCMGIAPERYYVSYA